MKYIKFKESSQNKGFDFEDLIQYLLLEEYGNKFEHTLYTNDGGKDFKTKETSVLSNNQNIWAECKNYSSTLSYNDLTKTLLMAYIKSVNKILVFSFSPVNHRFHRAVAEYKMRTGVEVEIYDDDVLEKLLLKYKNKDWFSDFLYLNMPEEPEMPLSSNLICQYQISGKYKQNPKTKKVQVNMHELFSLDLIIINKSLHIETAKIDFSDIENYNCFELLDETLYKNGYKKTVKVASCTSCLIRLKLRIVSFQEIYYLPKINVNGKTFVIRKKLYTNWLAEVSLLRDASQFNIDDCLKYIDNNQRLNVITIEGESGVGKSRFLLELHHSALRYDQQSFYFDIDKKEVTLKILCQELFSFFSKLPFFKQNQKYIAKLLNTDGNDNALEFSAQILYSPAFDFKKELDELVKFLFYYLKKHSTTILLDNVQKYDPLSIELIDRLIAFAANQGCPSTIVLSFNNIYMKEASFAHMLKNKLELLSTKNPKRFYFTKLKGFDNDIAYRYIKECLELDKSEMLKYDKFIYRIIERAGINPLVLQNYLIFLKRKNVIEIREHQLLIKDLDFLFEEKTTSADNFTNIFSQMDYDLYNDQLNKTSKIDYLQITGLLSICKNLKEKICCGLIQTPEILETLRSCGLLAYDCESRTYSFRHTEMKNYYKNKYGLRYINIPKALEVLKSSINKEQYIEQLFLLEIESDIINPETISKILKRISNYEMTFENTAEVFTTVLDLMNCNAIENSVEKIIILNQIVNYSTNYFGTEKALFYYHKVYQIIKDFFDIYKNCIESVISIFLEYLRHLLNTGRIEECNNFLTKMLSLSKALSNDCKIMYQTELYKIEVLANYKSGEFDKAISKVDSIRKMHLENSENYSEVQAECLMLQGNIYYKRPERFSYIDVISQSWEKAYSLTQLHLKDYFNMTWQQKSLILNLAVKKVISNMLTSKSKENDKIVLELEKLLNKTGMIYFEVKIRQLLSIYYMFTPDIESEKVNNALILAEETLEILCIHYGNKYMYATSLFLIAQIYKFKLEFNKMYHFFLNFYGVFSKEYFKENLSNNDDYLLIEMALCIKKYNTEIAETFNANIFNNIPNNNLYKKIKDIMDMDDLNFNNYFQKNCRQSLLYDPNGNCNYPMI